MIHAAAERRTDVVEKEPEAVQQLNVAATGVIAEVCGRQHGDGAQNQKRKIKVQQ